MGLGVSLLLIAVGAILVWGLQSDIAGISEDAIGVILMIVGGAGLIAGVALAVKTLRPGIQIFGVQAERAANLRVMPGDDPLSADRHRLRPTSGGAVPECRRTRRRTASICPVQRLGLRRERVTGPERRKRASVSPVGEVRRN